MSDEDKIKKRLQDLEIKASSHGYLKPKCVTIPIST